VTTEPIWEIPDQKEKAMPQAQIKIIEADEIQLTKTRDSSSPFGYAGSLVFRVIDSVKGENYSVAFLTADGSPGVDYDHAALMFYALEEQAGMQLGVGPGTTDLDKIKSPHVAALRVQRMNGLGQEEAMVWISTKEGPYKLAVIATGTGQAQPFEICIGDKCVTRYNSDGSKSEFWKGHPISRHEPRNGSLIFETIIKHPVINNIVTMQVHPVLLNAEPGTECNFKDEDGLIKKAIKQENGRWTRVSDNSYLW
jgi:hypothetical protein